ncbi:hypothetical protein NDU88_003472 [Pleurodeles waltl]|uniref:Uncharacterized protein n=1 Tax=Pleurodeles waltl TaxID=8319 RepID=A0AAV7V2H3_PLEWA|nr:hypothetical protein NDU88_003472 [Pleurodeles waltl]
MDVVRGRVKEEMHSSKIVIKLARRPEFTTSPKPIIVGKALCPTNPDSRLHPLTFVTKTIRAIKNRSGLKIIML